MRKSAFAPASEVTNEAPSPVPTQRFEEIETWRLVPSPDNPRKRYDMDRIRELEASFATHGVIENFVVRPWPESRPLPKSYESYTGQAMYEIAAGHRRHLAAVGASLSVVPCMVRELSDVALLEIFYIENNQREDLTPLEQGAGFQKLMDVGGYDVSGIAAKIGKSEGYVRARLQVDRLTGLARRALEADLITLSHALLIAPLSPEDQEAAAIETLGPQVDDEPRVTRKEYYNRPPVAASPSELREWIRTGLTPDLTAAPFDKTDPTLNPIMGACDGCPFRTINGLFADPADEDRCLKRPCFQVKLAAHVERKKAAAHSEGLLLLSNKYSTAPEGVVPKSDYTVVTSEPRRDIEDAELLSWAMDLALNDGSGGKAPVLLKRDTFDAVFGAVVEKLDEMDGLEPEDYDEQWESLNDGHDHGEFEYDTRKFVLSENGHEHPGLADKVLPPGTVRGLMLDGDKVGQVVTVKVTARNAQQTIATANPEAAAALSEKDKAERAVQREKSRVRRAEMLARRRALDAVLSAIQAASEEKLLKLAAARVDILVAVAAVKISQGEYSQNIYDSPFPEHMRHPGRRSVRTMLGLDRSGPGEAMRDDRVFTKTFKEQLVAYVTAATYDEVYVPDMTEPAKSEMLLLPALCQAFDVDLKTLRKAADWDTLTKGQKAERDAVQKKASEAKAQPNSAAKEKPKVGLSWSTKPEPTIETDGSITIPTCEHRGLPENVRRVDDSLLPAIALENAYSALNAAVEGAPATRVETYRVNEGLFICVGGHFDDDNREQVSVRLIGVVPRQEWTGSGPVDHAMGGVFFATRFFNNSGEEYVCLEAGTAITLVGLREAERIRVEKALEEKEAAVV